MKGLFQECLDETTISDEKLRRIWKEVSPNWQRLGVVAMIMEINATWAQAGFENLDVVD
jgi:hypothetical protein